MDGHRLRPVIGPRIAGLVAQVEAGTGKAAIWRDVEGGDTRPGLASAELYAIGNAVCF